MPCIKAVFLATLQLFGNVLPQQINEKLAVGSLDTSNLDIPTHSEFKRILSSLPEESLKLVLQHLPSFKDGIFEHNSNAIEAIHHTNPTMATSLVAVAARHDLYRRQGNVSSPATPTPPPPPPPPPTVIVPVPITTTNTAGSVEITTVTAVSSATTSVVVPVTSTNQQGQTTVVQSSVPAVVITSNGQVTATPAATFSSGSVVLTQTNQEGSTFVTTFTPGGGVVSSLVLETTTLPDGTRKTITSFAVVPASTRAPTNGPKLQGAASRARVSISGLLVVGLVVGVLLI